MLWYKVWGWTVILLALSMAILSIFVGCSLEEWAGVGKDAAQRAPGAIGRGIEGGPAGMIYEVIILIGGLAAGWYSRKYGVKAKIVPPHAPQTFPEVTN